MKLDNLTKNHLRQQLSKTCNIKIASIDDFDDIDTIVYVTLIDGEKGFIHFYGENITYYQENEKFIFEDDNNYPGDDYLILETMTKK